MKQYQNVIGIILEDIEVINFPINKKIKISIPELNISYNTDNPLLSNIKQAPNGGTYKKSNYISLYMPAYMYLCENEKYILKKGTKVVVSFIDGYLSKPYVSSIYEYI